MRSKIERIELLADLMKKGRLFLRSDNKIVLEQFIGFDPGSPNGDLSCRCVFKRFPDGVIELVEMELE